MADECKGRGDREMLSLIMAITKALRLCRHDEVFCRGLSFTQFIILDTVSEHEPMAMKKLGEILSVEKSTVTRLVKPLVQQNLITIGKEDSDSRKVILSLSEEGTKAYEDIMQCFLAFSGAVQSALPEEAKERSMKGVHLFLDALQNASEARNGVRKHRGRFCDNCC